MKRAAPFSGFEFLIAWSYLRAKRAEGGVSVMTLISLVGIALAVAALIIVLAVRSGFRTEFVDAILGANAHVTVYEREFDPQTGKFDYAIDRYAIGQILIAIYRIIKLTSFRIKFALINSDMGIRAQDCINKFSSKSATHR